MAEIDRSSEFLTFTCHCNAEKVTPIVTLIKLAVSALIHFGINNIFQEKNRKILKAAGFEPAPTNRLEP